MVNQIWIAPHSEVGLSGFLRFPLFGRLRFIESLTVHWGNLPALSCFEHQWVSGICSRQTVAGNGRVAWSRDRNRRDYK